MLEVDSQEYKVFKLIDTVIDKICKAEKMLGKEHPLYGAVCKLNKKALNTWYILYSYEKSEENQEKNNCYSSNNELLPIGITNQINQEVIT